MSKKEKKLQFHYVVQAQYEYRTAADTYLQYQSSVALNVAIVCAIS